MRGGVSDDAASFIAFTMVFPTCVGVFLVYHAYVCGKVGLPHMRGGVSIKA